MKYDLSQLITIDYETYYSSTYSLRSKKHNLSSYIMDDEFLIHCCAIKIGTARSKCYPRAEAIKILQGIDWSCHDLLAHNNFFDGAISAWHLGIRPRRRFCTLQMTRGLHSDMSRASLQAICDLYGIPGKIEGLENTKGKRELTKEEMADLLKYCNNDNEKCFQIFKKQISVYPEGEIKLIDLTLAMFCDPVFQLDVARAEKSLNFEMNERLRFIAISGHDEKTLTSTPKFIAALEALGVTAPTKISKYNGEVSYALAETDADFVMLQEHEDMRVVRLVQGRLAAKSTMMETRAWRMIQMQEYLGALAVMLNYFGAKTGRWSGANKMNFQNLPTSTKDFPMAGELRKAILAPKGHVIFAPDSAQIEARVLAWLTGNTGLLYRFRNKEDVYKWMASMIYGVPVEEIDSEQRFIGKICLAEGTLIYSDRGWIPIETLQPADKLWDGDGWVCHSGLVMNGYKETLSLSGLWLTPDHLVWSGTEWREAQYLERDADSLSRALESAAASSPSQVISDSLRGRLMPEINGESRASRKKCDVYDVLSVGPKNRFLALTDKGPLLVHNCVLGLGYGMGAKRFQTTLALGVMGPPMLLSMLECTKIVKLFRKINQCVVEFWRECEHVLEQMCQGRAGTFGPGELLEYDGTDIWLPNGMGLHYPGLKMTWDTEKNRRSGFSYMANGIKKNIYGGLLCENLTQALAGVVIREEMNAVNDYYKTVKLRKGEFCRIATMTHDEIISVVPERLAPRLLKENLKLMRTAPKWAPDMPIWAEAEYGYAANYSV